MNDENSYIQHEVKYRYLPSSTIITEFIPDLLLNGHSKKFVPDTLLQKVLDFIPDTTDKWPRI